MQSIEDNLRRFMQFATAIDLLKGNCQIDKGKKLKISELEDMFTDLAKGVGSMIKREGPYHLVEDLQDILRVQGYHLEDKPLSYQTPKATKAMNEFTEYAGLFHILAENPEEIRSNEIKKNKLLEVCNNLQILYCFRPL